MCICENKLNVAVKAVSAAAHKGQPLSVMYQDVQMLMYTFGLFFFLLAAVLCMPALALDKYTILKMWGIIYKTKSYRIH